MTRRLYGAREGIFPAIVGAADDQPRRPHELLERMRRAGDPRPAHSLGQYLAHLVASGRLEARGEPGRRTYVRTPLGDAYLQASRADMPVTVARFLLRVPGTPQPLARLARELGKEWGVHRAAVFSYARCADALGLVTRQPAQRGRTIALTDLGVAALPDARAVLAYAEAQP